MTARKRRAFVIVTLIIVAAITIVICVGYFARNKTEGFNGTLVEYGMDFPNYV